MNSPKWSHYLKCECTPVCLNSDSQFSLSSCMPPLCSYLLKLHAFLCLSPLFAHPDSSFMLPAQALCFATKEVPAQQTLKLQWRSLHSKCFGSHKSTSNAHLSPAKVILCSTFDYRSPSRFLPIYTLSNNNLCPYQNAVL
jgi:hypothetical protein